MLSVRMLKPYYIKTERNNIRVILAYQYFSVFVNDKVYQFIPIEGKEIRIQRNTQKIVNLDTLFAFQKGKDIIYISMAELISLPDFLKELSTIIREYYEAHIQEKVKLEPEKSDPLIEELEKININRLIDQALDERNEQEFYSLLELL